MSAHALISCFHLQLQVRSLRMENRSLKRQLAASEQPVERERSRPRFSPSRPTDETDDVDQPTQAVRAAAPSAVAECRSSSAVAERAPALPSAVAGAGPTADEPAGDPALPSAVAGAEPTAAEPAAEPALPSAVAGAGPIAPEPAAEPALNAAALQAKVAALEAEVAVATRMKFLCFEVLQKHRLVGEFNDLRDAESRWRPLLHVRTNHEP